MFWRSRKREDDLERELQSHLDAEAAEQQECGLSATDARYAARRALGNTTLLKEDVRARWGWSTVESLLQDVRYGLRILIRNYRVTLLTGAILGLAIGGGAAVFALIDAVFLRPLPGVGAPGQLVRFERVQPGLSATNFSYPDYRAYRDDNDSFSGLAAHCAAPLGFRGATTERVIGDLVTGNYFSVLGVRPAIGRLLMKDDERANATPVAVLSFAMWRRAFGSDPAIVGKSVALNGHRFEIVGVADASFIGTEVGQPIAVWIPLSLHLWGMPGLSTGILENRAAGWIDIFGRLKPRVGLAQAQADIANISGRLGREFSITNAHRRVRLIHGVGIDPDDQNDLGMLLGLLFGAVAILLATACANIATLLLARSMARSREIALRLAIGGARSRIIRQLVVEALVLSFAAGMFGVFLMPAVAQLMAMFRTSSSVLRGIDPAFDWRVAVFVVVIVAMLGVALGVLPAREGSRTELAIALKEGSRTSSTRHARKQQLLVACQLALSFLLLTGTGLMLETIHALLTIDPASIRGIS
jgi:predicted permease